MHAEINYKLAPLPVFNAAKQIALNSFNEMANVEDIAKSLWTNTKQVKEWLKQKPDSTIVYSEYDGKYDYRKVPRVVNAAVKLWTQNKIYTNQMTSTECGLILGVDKEVMYSWTRKTSLMINVEQFNRRRANSK